jgi:nicotinate-nucleotide pyrophosphorylase (carboxylating)
MPEQTATVNPLFDADLIRQALAEDIGRGDVTTEATIPAGVKATARIVTREGGVIAGLPLAERVFAALDPSVLFEALVADGETVEAGATLAQISGEARALLTAERVALNFLGRLSGIATLTARCVVAAKDTKARIVDTRKTTPGLRTLEKYAVRMGGGRNHRAGLDDGVLIKDNHIATAGGVRPAILRAREHASHLLRIEVECEDEKQVSDAVQSGADAILLDNMPPERLRANVEWIRAHAPRTIIEASGGIGTEPMRLAAVAATGVDLISLGALTHSAPNFDVSLEFDPAVKGADR